MMTLTMPCRFLTTVRTTKLSVQHNYNNADNDNDTDNDDADDDTDNAL